MEAGEPRNPEDVISAIQGEMIQACAKVDAKGKEKTVRSLGSKKRKHLGKE